MTEPKLPPLPNPSQHLPPPLQHLKTFSVFDMTTYATEAERLGYLRGLEEAAKVCDAECCPEGGALGQDIRALALKAAVEGER